MKIQDNSGRRFRLLPGLTNAEPRFFVIDGNLARCPCCYSMYSASTWGGVGRKCSNCGLEAKIDSFDTSGPIYKNFFENFRSDNFIYEIKRNTEESEKIFTAMAAECLLSANGYYTSRDLSSFMGRVLNRFVSKYEPKPAPWDSFHSKNSNVGLGIISRCSNFLDVSEIIIGLKSSIAEATVVVDTASAKEAELFEGKVKELVNNNNNVIIRVIPRLLAGNFSAQRNAVMENSRTKWVLWMDTDERPDESLLLRLPFLIEVMRRQGKQAARLKSIVNTGGYESLFSGYCETRLVRRDVRFVKPVHEAVSVPWHRIFTDLGCRYVHTQLIDDQLQKKIVYESITPGAGKPIDLIMKCLSVDGRIIHWIPGMIDLVEPL